MSSRVGVSWCSGPRNGSHGTFRFLWQEEAGGGSMSAVSLIDAVIEDRASCKKVGPQLELLAPDREAVDRLIAAYRDGRIPGWLAVYLLGCIGHVAGYETGKSILLANEGRGYAGVALVKI